MAVHDPYIQDGHVKHAYHQPVAFWLSVLAEFGSFIFICIRLHSAVH